MTGKDRASALALDCARPACRGALELRVPAHSQSIFSVTYWK